jgi:sec-independent protein translocase protein TatB
MLDLGWQELFLITLVALVVVGPKDLPLLIRTITGWIRGARKVAKDFQNSMEEVARETELDGFRKNLDYSFEQNISEFVSGEFNATKNTTENDYEEESIINQGELNENEITDGISLPIKLEDQMLQESEVNTKPENSAMDSRLLKSTK